MLSQSTRPCLPFVLLAGVFWMLFPFVAAAQHPPQEVFAGYSYFRFEPDDPENTDEEIESIDMHGFHVEFSRLFSNRFGVAIDASSHFKTFELGRTVLGPDTDLTLTHFSFMVGPYIRGFKWKRLRSSTRVLLGVSSLGVDVEGFYEEETVFAFVVGGAFMLDLNERLAWRIIQPNTFITTFDGNAQVNMRVSTGLNLSF